MNIGQRIKIRREELGMTQDELAMKIGYKSRSSINKIEISGRGFPQSKIEAFANALQTTPSSLMGWDDESKNLEFDIFEELLALSSWSYESRACCEIVGLNTWLDDNDKEPCPDGKNIPTDCDNCEYNKTYFYLTNGKQYFRLTEEEFDELCYCIKPYFNFRINELISKKNLCQKWNLT